jgi:hypothetical protein
LASQFGLQKHLIFRNRGSTIQDVIILVDHDAIKAQTKAAQSVKYKYKGNS